MKKKTKIFIGPKRRKKNLFCLDQYKVVAFSTAQAEKVS
jgi:hypothetical protein